jgi:hypothetical protein
MTIGMIVGLILLPFAWALLASANKTHRDETGVNAPTRDGWRRIRRNARKKGISEAEAYNQWLNRKSPQPPLTTDYVGHDDRLSRVNLAPPPKALSQEAADEPLHTAAMARNWSLQRQANGRYYILNLERSPSAFVRNPANRDGYDFAREEVERFLSA